MTEWLWGAPTAAVIALAACFVSGKLRFVQVRGFRAALRGCLSGSGKRGGGHGTSPLEAVCTALAGTVGTGNIVGVAVALSMGGPGAVFWMWVSAFLGMGLKYAEIWLAVRYREKRGEEYAGGPMYAIKNGLGRGFLPLAYAFALFGTLASFGTGNMLQVSSVMTLAARGPVPAPLLGAGLAALVLLTCRGGARGRGRTASFLTPLMAAVYALACLGVIGANIRRLPAAVLSIFQGAFGRGSLLGGTAGAALSWGFRRGLFSNEAGLGSSPIAHASAVTESPDRQALYGIFEVFADTVILCTLTALTILTAGVPIPLGAPAGAALVSAALSSVYGGAVSGAFLSVSLTLFAFSSIVSWSLYGERCVEFLAGPSLCPVYRVSFAAATFLASMVSFPAVLAFSDTSAFFMMASNLAAVCILTGKGKCGGGIP